MSSEANHDLPAADPLGHDVLTEAQKAEIDRRLAAHRANPGQGRPFEEVVAEIEAELGE